MMVEASDKRCKQQQESHDRRRAKKVLSPDEHPKEGEEASPTAAS
jgi:hypothetical protein